jgi:hypothetical protein
MSGTGLSEMVGKLSTDVKGIIEREEAFAIGMRERDAKWLRDLHAVQDHLRADIKRIEATAEHINDRMNDLELLITRRLP